MALTTPDITPDFAPKPNRFKDFLRRREYNAAHWKAFTFIMVFAFIGSLIVWDSLAAAPVIATLDATQMELPIGANIIANSPADNGQAVRLTEPGTSLSGSVNLPSNATSMVINAFGTKCGYGWPTLTVTVDGITLLSNVLISSKNWTNYTTTVSLNSAVHNLSIIDTSKVSCRYLYINNAILYGPTAVTPSPTISLTASPISVTTGSASSLNWITENASSCQASGAWGGTEATSGSVSTGALNSTSSYTLNCIGAGGSVSSSVTVTVTPQTVGSGSGSSSLCETVAIPAYFDPTDNLKPWAAATSAKPGVMIANLDNGPGTSIDSSYPAAIASARAAGISVFGYVDTGYMAKSNSIATIEATVSSWKSIYGVTNIFFDNVSSSANLEPDYQTLSAYVHLLTKGSLTILNPGDIPDQNYMKAGDIIDIFEGNYASYQSAIFPSWIKTYPASRFYNIIYNVPSAAAMTSTLIQAANNGVQYVYATNQTLPNPYGVLPTPTTYLTAETSAAAVNCSL